MTGNRNHGDFEYGRPMPWIDLTGGPTLAQMDAARWHADAACAGSTNWGWFVAGRDLRVQDHLSICSGCPVRRICLASSLVYAEEYGTWGGLTAASRKPLSRALAAGARLGEVLDSALPATQRRAAA